MTGEAGPRPGGKTGGWRSLRASLVRAGPKKIEKQRGHSDEEHCHDERLDADAEPPSGSSSGAEPIDTAEASGLKRFGGRQTHAHWRREIAGGEGSTAACAAGGTGAAVHCLRFLNWGWSGDDAGLGFSHHA